MAVEVTQGDGGDGGSSGSDGGGGSSGARRGDGRGGDALRGTRPGKQGNGRGHGGRGRGAAPPPPQADVSPPHALIVAPSLQEIDRKDSALRHLKKADVDAVLDMRENVTGVSWGDVVGVESTLALIDENVIQPFLQPDLYYGITSASKGMLLFGPPGTGKTMIAKAVAAQAGLHFFNVECANIDSKYHGESVKIVSALFTVARAARPGAIIFMDECDSLLRKPGSGDDSAADLKIVNQFKASWAGVVGDGEGQVFVIGATNNPWDLEDAITRPGRMDFRVLVPLPNPAARRAMLEGWLRKDKRSYDCEAIEGVINATEGYSGADMKAVLKEAAMGPVREARKQPVGTPQRPITGEDFQRGCDSVPRSVDDSIVAQHNDYNSKFGRK